MKIVLKKDIAKERQMAREQLDHFFAMRIATAIGPKAELYAVKYAAALAFSNGHASPLIENAAEAEAIIQKNHDMQAALASVESERQALQAEIDHAATARDIETILERIANEVTL